MPPACRYLDIGGGLFNPEPGSTGQHQWQCYYAAGSGGGPTVLSGRTDNRRKYVPLEFNLTGGVEIFDVSSAGASTFAGTTLSIPALSAGDVSYWVELVLIADNPIRFRLGNAGVNESPVVSAEALELFQTTISPTIVQSRCIVCHVEGGLSGHTRLVLMPGTDQIDHNIGIFQDFVNSINGGGDLLLDKVRGVAHGGDVQLAGDSSSFQDFDDFLGLVGFESNSTSVSAISFFDAITLLSAEQTLRKTTELLQGRLPTVIEINLVKAGDENTLKTSILGLMEGATFKHFIRVNANDILLTTGAADIEDAFRPDHFIDGTDVSYQVYLATGDEEEALAARAITSNYVRRQPLELVSYVIENERPYTEILTADYIMVNSVLNITYQAGADFIDQSNVEEWQPGTINNYVLHNENSIWKISDDPLWPDLKIAGGDIVDYPHAGILNTPAFLTRYPSTATNRNRARARWTYMFFLGVDIEASAARTTDPLALADTNNPTMNNPNCTVCHEIHDPVAGAFQNYGHDFGWYRENGTDSLDQFYKWPEDGSISLYEDGDTWYRDMREPGFNGMTTSDADNSLQWLAQEIANDPRFATASVKFWWPAVFGSKPVLIPEVETDVDFQERLTAFEVENDLINELADGFLTGFSDFGPFNLKDLLAEMIMSPRFRAGNLDGASEADRIAYSSIGPGRILTPEMMQTKFENVLGFKWLQYYDAERDIKYPYMTTDYLYLYLYGGIDSVGITDRAKDYSTVMRAIVELLGNEGGTNILGNDLIKIPAERVLFPCVEMTTNPNMEFRQSFELTGDGKAAEVVNTATSTLSAGDKIFILGFVNQYSEDWEAGEFNRLNISALTIRDSQGNSILDLDINRLFETPGIDVPCGEFGSSTQNSNDYWRLDGCEIRIPGTILQAGDYTISATVWPKQYGPANVIYTLGADATGEFSESLANGAQAIKQNIQLLVNRIWNKNWNINHEEIQIAYALWIDIYSQSLTNRIENPEIWS